METVITFSLAKAGTRTLLRREICRSSCCAFSSARFGHVSYERILSGPGLVNVYEFLRDSGCGKESPELAVAMKKGDPAAANLALRLNDSCSAGGKGSGSVDRVFTAPRHPTWH